MHQLSKRDKRRRPISRILVHVDSSPNLDILRVLMSNVAALQAEVAASSATLVQIMSMDEATLSSALEAAGLPRAAGSKAEMANKLRNH
eukprot:2022179-Prymnesium_polylepis.1